MKLILPFPPADLSGHNKGHWRSKVADIRTLRLIACSEVKKAGFKVPAEGDIHITFLFIPPNNMGDRVNYPIRIKPLVDGIADGLKVNDRRFHPHYIFEPPCAPGRVEVYVG